MHAAPDASLALSLFALQTLIVVMNSGCRASLQLCITTCWGQWLEVLCSVLQPPTVPPHFAGHFMV